MGLYSWIEKSVAHTSSGGRTVNKKTTVASWGKDWMVHSWFVNHVQGGQDNCRPSPFSIEKVRELREVCNSIVAAAQKETEGVADRGSYEFSIERTKEVVGMFVPNPEECVITRPMGWDFIVSIARTCKQLDSLLADYEREIQNGKSPRYTYTGSW